eukprot:979038-Pyramimonas_sp.AAC.3
MESLLNTLKEKKAELVDGNIASVKTAFDSSIAKASEATADALTQAKEQYEDKLGTAKESSAKDSFNAAPFSKAGRGYRLGCHISPSGSIWSRFDKVREWWRGHQPFSAKAPPKELAPCRVLYFKALNVRDAFLYFTYFALCKLGTRPLNLVWYVQAHSEGALVQFQESEEKFFSQIKGELAFGCTSVKHRGYLSIALDLTSSTYNRINILLTNWLRIACLRFEP